MYLFLVNLWDTGTMLAVCIVAEDVQKAEQQIYQNHGLASRIVSTMFVRGVVTPDKTFWSASNDKE